MLKYKPIPLGLFSSINATSMSLSAFKTPLTSVRIFFQLSSWQFNKGDRLPASSSSSLSIVVCIIPWLEQCSSQCSTIG